MSRVEQLTSRMIELKALAPLLKNLPKFLPNTPYGAARLLREQAERDPSGLALVYGSLRLSWAELDGRVNQFARFFQSRGIGQRDTVALLMDNRPEYVFAFLALARLRAIAALINTHLGGAPLAHALSACAPRAVLVGSEHELPLSELALEPSLPVWVHEDEGEPRAEPRFERVNAAVARQSTQLPLGLTPESSSDVLCFIYTSGTTGLPKAAVVTQRRWVAAGYIFGRVMMEATARDVIYVSLPLYHSNAAVIALSSALVSGASIALRRKFSASQFWSDVRKYDASIFIYIGELCRYLVHAPRSVDERSHRLRLGLGNGLRGDVWRAFQARFGVPTMREFYAATEGNLPILNLTGRVGMLGRLYPGQVLVRCDPTTGEIARDPRGFAVEAVPGELGALLVHINPLFSFEGYLDARATQEKVVCDVRRRGDRYFHSGDLLQLHEDSWVSFVDRVGDTYRWKGENVSTQEVSEALHGAPGVLESCVFGVALPGAEGRVGMAVLRTSGEFDLASFARFVHRKLPTYQRPQFLRLTAGALRATSTFKHQKGSYRDDGYDPTRVADPLYVLEEERYIPLDDERYAQLQRGEPSVR